MGIPTIYQFAKLKHRIAIFRMQARWQAGEYSLAVGQKEKEEGSAITKI